MVGHEKSGKYRVLLTGGRTPIVRKNTGSSSLIVGHKYSGNI